MIKKIFYQNKFLFSLLKQYWTLVYFFKIFILDSDNYFSLTKSQFNDEENIFISSLSKHLKNKNFVEIGYHYRELNCSGLMKNNFEGKMVDADMANIFNSLIMRMIVKRTKRNVKVFKRFVNLKNIDDIFDMKNLGCLSIDIDGNEYWILQEILSKKVIPEIIVTEYNASFLNHEITVPYDENFDIHKKHPSLWYHGASLSAFNKLLLRYNFSLVKVINGTNAIFVLENVLKDANLKKFLPSDVYQECESRNKKGNNSAKDQFETIKHLPLVSI